MSMVRNAVPASLRRPVEIAGLVQGTGRGIKPLQAIAHEAGNVPPLKSWLGRLPEESEDARLTGATRSLNRRLLALNVPGSFRMSNGSLLPKTA